MRLDNNSEGRSFFHLDILGSTVNLSDASAATRQSILYDAWGNERDRAGTSSNRFTFTGHEKDEETGLIYAKARFYDADSARFLTQDAFLGQGDVSPSLHRYSYAYSNPLLFVDPTGRYAILETNLPELIKEAENFQADLNEVVGERLNKVGDPVVNRRPPSRVLANALEMYGGREEALRALRELQDAGLKTFAVIVLERRDFNDKDELIQERVYEGLIRKTGNIAEKLEGLRESFFEQLAGARPNEAREISFEVALGRQFSLNEVERVIENIAADAEPLSSLPVLGELQRAAGRLSLGFAGAAPGLKGPAILTIGSELYVAGEAGRLALNVAKGARARLLSYFARQGTLRLEDLISRAELAAFRELKALEEANPGAHFLARHGAQTSLEQQFTRATTRLRPDGGMDPVLGPATRFLSHEDELEAIKRAMDMHRNSGGDVFDFSMGRMIGEGFTRGAGELVWSSNVRVIFRNGKPWTAYPLVRVVQ